MPRSKGIYRNVEIRRPNDIDCRVGQNIRLARVLAGESQEQLAAALGLTFQQIQKYERGTNRVSAGRLYALSQHFGRPLAWFFGDTGGGIPPSGTQPIRVAPLFDPTNRELLEIGRAYSAIPNKKLRIKALGLLRALGGAPGASAN
jgi:transcriptional regulator with XRE-family HTH domain